MAEGHRRDGVRTFADTAANGEVAPKAVIGTALFKPGPAYDGHALETVARFSISGNLPHRASHTSSKRQPLKMLLAMIVMPLTYGCQHVADRTW